MNTPSDTDAVTAEFERRTREVLLGGVERLSGNTRSRLTQARYAALEAATARRRHRVQRWAPAGAAVAAALALLIVFLPHTGRAPIGPLSNGALEDLDVLASDVPLNADQDLDFDFYEWAVDQAQQGGAGTARTAGAPSAGA